METVEGLRRGRDRELVCFLSCVRALSLDFRKGRRVWEGYRGGGLSLLGEEEGWLAGQFEEEEQARAQPLSLSSLVFNARCVDQEEGRLDGWTGLSLLRAGVREGSSEVGGEHKEGKKQDLQRGRGRGGRGEGMEDRQFVFQARAFDPTSSCFSIFSLLKIRCRAPFSSVEGPQNPSFPPLPLPSPCGVSQSILDFKSFLLTHCGWSTNSMLTFLCSLFLVLLGMLE